jgi:hypothetical protein
MRRPALQRHSRTHARLLGLRKSGQSGQTTLEYLGLVLVVVAIIGALVGSGIGAELTERISAQVCRIGGGGNCGDDGGGDSQADGPKGADGNANGDAEPADKTQAEKDYDKAVKDLQDAEGEYDKEKKRAIEAAKKLAAILAEEFGITDAVKCFTEGDPSSCTETAINVVMSLIGSLPAKVLKKYGWPTKWKKGKKIVESIVKHGGDVVGGAKGMWKAKKKVNKLKGRIEDLKKKLPKREKKPKDKDKPTDCPVKHSFLPGTPVLLADGSRRAIDDVRVGDRVLSTDPERGLTQARRVTDTITTEDDKDFTRLTVSVSGHATTLTATDTHPFWLVDKGRWADAGDIIAGDELRTPAGGTLTVTAVHRYVKRQRTHDLTVDAIHTYYVLAGKTPVLVHNANCGPSLKDLQKDYPRRTVGILDVGGDQLPMISGPGGQSGLLKNLPGRTKANAEHVETHAAAFLRMNPGVRKAVLYIDYPTGACGTCRSTLPDMLPEGAQLWVISPRRTEKFVGLPD